MNNRQRAAEVIRTWQARHKTELDNNPDWAAQNLAGDLAVAGALAPEEGEGFHYEYAVLEDVGYYRQRGEWFDTFGEAAEYRDMKREDAPMYIVRHLVSDIELVEDL